jgi:hypothetical protein
MSAETTEDPTCFRAGLFPILAAGMQMLRRLEPGPEIKEWETSCLFLGKKSDENLVRSLVAND